MSEALSPKAEKLLEQVVALKGQYMDGYVPDEILLEAPEIGPLAYDPAAQELIDKKYVVNRGQTSDPAFLKATPKGIRLVEGV